MKTQLIVNPTSAGGKLRARWDEIRQTLEAENFPFEAAFTECRGHASELARAALARGCDLVVAVGGDGTLNEVLNGMIQDGTAIKPDASLGVISTGTGSDFARTLGLPRDMVAEARRLAKARTKRSIDVGEVIYPVNGESASRYFINVAGMGFDGEVIQRIEKNGKRGAGTLPYLTTLILTISAYHNKDLTLKVDGQPVRGRMNAVVVSNGKYFGGGMMVAPHALLDDGQFDVITIGDMNTFEVLMNTPKIYKGTHLSHPKVSEYHGRTVQVEPEQQMLIQVDGELVGPGPATFRIHPGMMNLWV